MHPIVITDTAIRQDESGRFCLNDLHRASGGEARHKPANWLRMQSTQELSEVIEAKSVAQIRAIVTNQGLGSFVAREMVYAYAMWISADFHYEVISTFDALKSGAAPAADPVAALADPAALRGLLLSYTERVIELQTKIAKDQPKVEFAEAVRGTEDTISLAVMANFLDIGRNTLFSRLRKDRVLMEDNRPYQRYIDMGYFRVAENVFRDDEGAHVTYKTLVTGAGQVFLQRKYKAAA